jgi:diguanylate cyclase (GGDEF)-like protein
MADETQNHDPPRRPGDGAPAGPLDELVRALAELSGLPAADLARRVQGALPSAIAELADSNRRLRELSHRREALVAAAAAELRVAAETLHDGDPERVAAALRLARVAEDLERSLHATDDPEVAPRAAPPVGPRPRVLVADDDEDARAALQHLLSPDCEVITAADGEQVLQRVRSEHPDLVLMDLFMPRLDGLQALERLRSDAATADVPVIFVSARGDVSVKARALDLGAVDYLQKPFSEVELRARVERTLRLARAQTALREAAQTDPLTGLANLRAFRARLDEEIKRARRYRTPLTCVMADMDHLKPINDQLGHAAGDRAIAAVAGVIRSELRETDFGARYGGDEFVLLLPHTTSEEGLVLAERVCARLRESALEMSGRRIPLGASFGVSCLPEADGGGAEELVRNADVALYRAKRAGRGRVAVHGPDDVEGPREHA